MLFEIRGPVAGDGGDDEPGLGPSFGALPAVIYIAAILWGLFLLLVLVLIVSAIVRPASATPTDWKGACSAVNWCPNSASKGCIPCSDSCLALRYPWQRKRCVIEKLKR